MHNVVHVSYQANNGRRPHPTKEGKHTHPHAPLSHPAPSRKGMLVVCGVSCTLGCSLDMWVTEVELLLYIPGV